MRRIPSTIIIVGLLGAASLLTLALGTADRRAAQVAARLHESVKARETSVVDLTAEQRAELLLLAKETVDLAPGNGDFWAGLARVESEPIEAYKAIQRAAVEYPASPFIWAELLVRADRMYAEGRLQNGKADIETALERASGLGRREVGVLARVADVGFANWTALGEDSRKHVLTSAMSLVGSRPELALSIAEKRGRLDLICGDARLSGTKRCASVGGGD